VPLSEVVLREQVGQRGRGLGEEFEACGAGLRERVRNFQEIVRDAAET